MDRITRMQSKYRQLFGEPNPSAPQTDPEFMAILQHLIFGEVFFTGDLSDQERELITVVVLAVNQTLPQLKAHTAAALNVGVTPLEVREVVYQCAPFIGFPKTLNAVAVINEVFKERGIELPLPEQGTTSEADRFEQGQAIQQPIYGNEIREGLKGLPESLRDAMPDFLTAFGFGDFYTRGSLDTAQRELLVLCILAALGGVDAQISAHARGNLQVGNSLEKQLTALIHCFPYIGFPRALNAIRKVQEAGERAE